MKFKLHLKNTSTTGPKEKRCQFWEPGLVSYKDSGYGVALLKKETMEKMLPSFIGCPVVVQHKDGSAEEILNSGNAIGKVTSASWNPETGWFDCTYSVNDEKQKEVDALEKDGWSVSCAFDSDDTGPAGEWHALPYNFEIVDGHFTHLALVPNPRYEDSKIFANQKCFINSKVATILKENAQRFHIEQHPNFEGKLMWYVVGEDNHEYAVERTEALAKNVMESMGKQNSKKEQVYKELTELGKLGTLGKDYHKYFRRLEATDVDKEFHGMSVSDIADQIVMLEGGAQNSKENGEVKCRYCGRPSEDRSGVCDACERKYENAQPCGKKVGHLEKPVKDNAGGPRVTVMPINNKFVANIYVGNELKDNTMQFDTEDEAKAAGQKMAKEIQAKQNSTPANARLRASALNWDIISSEQIKQNDYLKKGEERYEVGFWDGNKVVRRFVMATSPKEAIREGVERTGLLESDLAFEPRKQNAKVKLYMKKDNAAGGFTNPPNIGDIVTFSAGRFQDVKGKVIAMGTQGNNYTVQMDDGTKAIIFPSQITHPNSKQNMKDWQCCECGKQFNKKVPADGEMTCPGCGSTDIDVGTKENAKYRVTSKDTGESQDMTEEEFKKMGPKPDHFKIEEIKENSSDQRCCVKVTFSDGDSLVTQINTDLEGAKKYYLGKQFNLGQGDQDKMVHATKVELVNAKENDRYSDYNEFSKAMTDKYSKPGAWLNLDSVVKLGLMTPEEKAKLDMLSKIVADGRKQKENSVRMRIVRA